MLNNALRQELNGLLAGIAAARPPALRRSLSDEWLYAADLPAVCGGEETAELLKRAEALGWEHAAENGWILFRKEAKEPPEGWYDGGFGPEAACCLSLLERHPDGCGEGAPAAQRALIKAGEEGGKAYEAVCRRLHREWAERLRKGLALPGLSPAYFRTGKEEETC